MSTRSFKDIVGDLRETNSQEGQLSSEAKKRLDCIATEIESKAKAEKKDFLYMFLLFTALLLGASIMWMLSEIRVQDVLRDNEEKTRLINKYEKLVRFENDSTHTFVYREKDGRPITYQELMDENLSLLNQNANLNNELSRKNIYLDVIRQSYGIKVYDKDNRIWAQGAKVDSALLLLEVYRDKLEYDPKEKVWWIKK